MKAMIPIARSGIFLIPGILLCERSALRSRGWRLHFRSLSKLRESAGVAAGSKEAIVNDQDTKKVVRYRPKMKMQKAAKEGFL